MVLQQRRVQAAHRIVAFELGANSQSVPTALQVHAHSTLFDGLELRLLNMKYLVFLLELIQEFLDRKAIQVANDTVVRQDGKLACREKHR